MAAMLCTRCCHRARALSTAVTRSSPNVARAGEGRAVKADDRPPPLRRDARARGGAPPRDARAARSTTSRRWRARSVRGTRREPRRGAPARARRAARPRRPRRAPRRRGEALPEATARERVRGALAAGDVLAAPRRELARARFSAAATSRASSASARARAASAAASARSARRSSVARSASRLAGRSASSTRGHAH